MNGQDISSINYSYLWDKANIDIMIDLKNLKTPQIGIMIHTLAATGEDYFVLEA